MSYEPELPVGRVAGIEKQIESRISVVLVAGLLFAATGSGLVLLLLALEVPPDQTLPMSVLAGAVAISGLALVIGSIKTRSRAGCIPRVPIRLTSDQLVVMEKVRFSTEDLQFMWIREAVPGDERGLEYYIVVRRGKIPKGRDGVLIVGGRWIAERARFEETMRGICAVRMTQKPLRELGHYRLVFAIP